MRKYPYQDYCINGEADFYLQNRRKIVRGKEIITNTCPKKRVVLKHLINNRNMPR